LVVVSVAAIIALAWINGGRRPVEWIEEPIALPEGVE